MTRKEAINIIKSATVYTPEEMEALETIIPDFRESEDERIRKALIHLISEQDGILTAINGVSVKDILAYLEKQKEQPKEGLGKYSEEENLAYRLNGLMQEYIKEGKDDAEKEHRFKCYHLFWDALEDANFFEQKEQNNEAEEYTDFTIYHPLKNAKGEYECIPYSFYGSLTSFSEDKDLIDFLRTCFYTEEECNKWIEKQKEQKPVNWTELTWEDIVELEGIINNVHYDFSAGIGQESFGKEVLERFRNKKDDAEVYACEQKLAEWNPSNEDVTLFNKAVTTNPALTPAERAKLNIIRMKFKHHPVIKQEEQKSTHKFRVGDTLISTKNSKLTYKILEVGHINELGNPEYKVEIFEDGKSGIMNKPHNIHYMECHKVDEWSKLIEQKPEEWAEDYREEDIQTRFAFYTYKDNPSVLYLSNVFVEEASRNHGFGTKILIAAEKVAEIIGATTISLKVKQDSPANAWYRKNGYGYVTFEDGYDWLEKNLEYMNPNKQEWSEEDENIIKNLIELVEAQPAKDFYESSKDTILKRLKSLRPSWRPSEEQMEALEDTKMRMSLDGYGLCPLLQTLINDLKKLM